MVVQFVTEVQRTVHGRASYAVRADRLATSPKDVVASEQREGPPGLQVMMLLNSKFRRKLCSGAVAVKFVTKR